MNTTINETKATNCPRCAGKGRISAFSYNKGGTCFGCNGTGSIYSMVSRPMTDAEMIASLAAIGLSIMPQETTKAPTGDWFFDMMPTAEESALEAAAMIGARRLLEIA
jgi:DnaJ-class molecular chaperone